MGATFLCYYDSVERVKEILPNFIKGNSFEKIKGVLGK